MSLSIDQQSQLASYWIAKLSNIFLIMEYSFSLKQVNNANAQTGANVTYRQSDEYTNGKWSLNDIQNSWKNPRNIFAASSRFVVYDLHILCG